MQKHLSNPIVSLVKIAIICMMTLGFSSTIYGFGGGKKEAPVTVTDPCKKESALSTCLKATKSTNYYVEQSIMYFQTMDSSVPIWVIPNYSSLVVRWEWEPWLLLTGYGDWNMTWTDIALKIYKTSYAKMDCRFFDVQPFGRCHVIFDYDGTYCPIYEEFTFNDQGEITFIEAWTDHAGYLPMDPAKDYWAEGKEVRRLSTKVPGLGNKGGLIELNASWMNEAAAKDKDVAEFQKRAKWPIYYWFQELAKHGTNVMGGCNPPK